MKEEAGGGGRRRSGAALKTKTPHVNVGKNRKSNEEHDEHSIWFLVSCGQLNQPMDL